jgi:hypothetical protein
MMSEWPEYIYGADEWPEEVELPVEANARPPQYWPELGLVDFEFEDPSSPFSALEVIITFPLWVEMEQGDEVKLFGEGYKIVRIMSVVCRAEMSVKYYSLRLEPA